jgi:hypothetical protein
MKKTHIPKLDDFLGEEFLEDHPYYFALYLELNVKHLDIKSSTE